MFDWCLTILIVSYMFVVSWQVFVDVLDELAFYQESVASQQCRYGYASRYGYAEQEQ